MNVRRKRIEWIDIFKGMAIILVVTGHATGLFNAYIYQFHVAAFFFLSGWVAKLDETGVIEDLYKKVMTLLLPLLTMVIIFGIITNIMNLCGIYKYFWNEGDSQGIFRLVKAFLKNGTMIDLLGAAWFVIVLFFASVFSHLLYVITGKRKSVFIVLSMVIYIAGYYKMREGYTLPYGADMALIAQGYYGAGYVLKCLLPDRFFEKKNRFVLRNVAVLLLTSFFMYWMKAHLHGLNLTNLASREINSLGWTSLAIVNGIVWLCALSQIICCTKIVFLRKGLVEIGKNTMGIMLLHFLFFRVVSVVLFVCGKVELSELRNLVPSANVGNTFWLLYVIVSVAGSIGIWKIMIRVPVLRQLLGADKEFLYKVLKFKSISVLEKVYDRLTVSVKTGKKWQTALVVPAILIIILLCGKCILTYNDKKGEDIIGEIQITFPYEGKVIHFEKGWLDQDDKEAYRWVEQESIFEVNLSNQSVISLSGYVSEGSDVSHVDVYLNDFYITGSDVSEGNPLQLEGRISKVLRDGNDVFKIVFNGERIPEPDDMDQRKFSAMFTSIEIK